MITTGSLTLRRNNKLLWIIPIAFMGVVFYFPLLEVLQIGFGGHLNGSNASEISVWPVLWFTLWQAVVSTGICLLIGIPAAYIFYRRSFRGVNLIRSLITVPFMLPSLIVAMAIIEMGRPFGGFDPVVAIILANVFANFAVVVRTVGSQWQTLADNTEEEAELNGSGRLSTALRISLPQLATSIRSSSAIIVLYCASSYGIVLSLGGGRVNTLETAISVSVLQRLDLQHGATLALLQVAFTIAAFTASRWGGANPLSFEPGHGKARKLDRRDFLAATYTFTITAFLVIIPLVMVFAKAFLDGAGNLTLDNFLLLDGRGYRDLLNISFLEAGFNSLRNLVVSTLIAMFIGGLASYLLAERTRKRRKRKDPNGIVLDAIFLLPIGVSSVVLGLGYLISLNGNLAELRSQWLLVPLVQSVFAVPMVIRVLYPALMSIDSAPREQAMTDGANSLGVFYFIDLALIGPAVKTAVAFSALVSLGEFGVASLLSYGDQSTVPMLLYQLIARPGNNNYEMALAVAAILFVITTLVVLWVSRDTRVSRKRRAKR